MLSETAIRIRNRRKKMFWVYAVWFTFLVALVAWYVHEPYLLLYKEVKAERSDKLNYDAVANKGNELISRQNILSTNQGKIVEAREQGYVKPGEEVIIVPLNSTPPQEKPEE